MAKRQTPVPRATLAQRLSFLLFGYRALDGKQQKRKIKKVKKTRRISMGKKCYTNRELSWLQFNERVLNEAGNPRVPLAERLSFAAIYQSNLDEFFMVRVGTLMAQIAAGDDERDNKTNMTAKEQVAAIVKRTAELEEKKGRVYEQLMGELEPYGVRIINFNKLSNEEGALLEGYFDAQIAPFLSPMIISSQQPFPFLNNQQLYAVALLERGGKTRMGIVPCYNSVFRRLIEIPTRPGNFMLSEELILHFAAKLFRKYTVKEKSIMRITRNADLDTINAYDEDLDYRDNMEQLIRRRKRLGPVRLELSRTMGKKVRTSLADYLGIKQSHVFQSATPLDLTFVSQLQDYLHPKRDLFYPRRVPQLSPALDLKRSIIDQIRQKDVLLSYPFESMRPFLQLLHEAGQDERVMSIKMTLYRVASHSKVVEHLVEAAENGKDVTVLMELRARFDEANNIEMSRRLEDAGCRVIYGLPDYKVHSKLCLITCRDEDGTISYITQFGTGNYNEKTAQAYTDLSLMTANAELGAETAQVFTALSCGETVEECQHLMVAPHCLQSKVLELIERETEKGENGYIGAKINSLTDKDIIKKLIAASKAGVQIELIVRGICCLKPKVPEKTEHITIVSVVGRFLEHSRIYRFGRAGAEDERLYIASADFMTRNTLRRVEVAAPIYDEDVKTRIRHIFDTVMQDDEKGKEQQADGSYTDRHLHDEPLNSQEQFYDEAYEAARQAGERI